MEKGIACIHGGMLAGSLGLTVVLLLASKLASAQISDARMLVQSSPLAGFQFYEGRELWEQMKVGDALDLVREAGNPHDANAVRVEWQGHKLGYVPRRENAAVASHLDRGGKVEARVSKLQAHRNPWQRIEFEVFVRL
jgi:hypothetical protein